MNSGFLRHYMVRVPEYLWKRNVDQLVKYNPQFEPENEWDEVEISLEKSWKHLG
jgi:hypothetical protein